MKIKWIMAASAISLTMVLSACSPSGAGSSAQSAAPNTAAQAANGKADTANTPAAQSGSGAAAASGQGSQPQNGSRQPDPARFAAGQVKQVNGNSIELTTANNGSLTVNVGDQTRITKMGQGSVGDLTAGASITVQGTKGANGEMAAQTIRLGRRGGNRPGTPGPGQGRPNAGGQGAGGQNGNRQFNPNNFAFGQIKQISGNTLVLTTPNNGDVTVTIGDQTQIEKTVQGSLSDIQPGQRISAQGTRASDGTFAADSIQIGGNQPGRPAASNN
jgi:hypothetical protein